MSIPAQANKYQLKANFRNGIQNKKLWIILLLANVFAVPFAILNIGFFGGDSILSFALTGFAMVVNMMLGIVIPFMQFDYCYEKTKVDMAYSLPLTRKQKFLTDFFAGLAMYVGAYLIQIVLSYVATGLFLQFASVPNSFSYYASRMKMLGSQWMWSNVTKILVIVLLIQILLYVVTSFVLSCTGAIFEAVSATIYFNILIPTTIYVTYLLCAQKLFGMDLSDNFNQIVFRTSPLGGFIYLMNIMNGSNHFISWLVSYCIVIVAFFVATYFIMIRRKAEAVGKPFVVRTFYHIILVAVMLHIGVLACYTTNSIVSFLLMTAIFYLVIEMITNRGLKKIGQSVVRYGVIIATVLVVIITINKTNSFGIAYQVADAKDVGQITISYPGLFSGFYSHTIDLTSKDNIERLLEVQKDLIDQYKEKSKETEEGLFSLNLLNTYEWTNFASETLRMEVYKNNGKSYYRTYNIPYSSILKLLDVELSDEYINNKIEVFRYNTTYLTVSDVYGVNQKVIVNDTNGQPSVVLNEFFEALKEDLLQTTKEEYLQPQNTVKYKANTDLGTIYILDSYTNAIAFLEKYNAMPTTTDEDYENIVESSEVEIFPMLDDNNTLDSYYDNFDGYYTTSCSPYYSTDGQYIVSAYNGEVKQLLEVAQIQYASDAPCYKLVVYGTNYMIPPEYSKLVEKVIANYSMHRDDYYSEKYR